MTRRTMLVKAAAAAAVGLAVAAVAWAFGPRIGVGLALGVVAAGGLLLVEWGRVRSTRMVAAKLQRLQHTADRIAGESARRADLAATERRLKEAAADDFKQVEALLNLHQLVAVRGAMPATRKWAASPDLLLLLVSLVEQHRPATIVELGSGATTIWLATAMRAGSIDGRIVSLDHEEKYAQLTRATLAAHGLEKMAEVRHARLVDAEYGGQTSAWYDLTALADVRQIDLLLVDGPPGILHEHARYPALPALIDRLAPGAHVVLDDYGRAAEKEIVQRWRAEFPGWGLRELAHEKGTAVLRR